MSLSYRKERLKNLTGPKTCGKLRLRQVTRRMDNGHQTLILTSRRDLPAAQVAYRMFDRWRQENFFKYLREEYALDALVALVPFISLIAFVALRPLDVPDDVPLVVAAGGLTVDEAVELVAVAAVHDAGMQLRRRDVEDAGLLARLVLAIGRQQLVERDLVDRAMRLKLHWKGREVPRELVEAARRGGLAHG